MNKKLLVTGALSIATLIGAVGGSLLQITETQAADVPAVTVTPSAVQTTLIPQSKDPTTATHVGNNGTKEVLLTGDTAEKVKAASLAAVPGGTIERVETDSEGSPYEAHMKKGDGTRVTVKLDSNFTVTTVEAGHSGKKI